MKVSSIRCTSVLLMLVAGTCLAGESATVREERDPTLVRLDLEAKGQQATRMDFYIRDGALTGGYVPAGPYIASLLLEELRCDGKLVEAGTGKVLWDAAASMPKGGRPPGYSTWPAS